MGAVASPVRYRLRLVICGAGASPGPVIMARESYFPKKRIMNPAP